MYTLRLTGGQEPVKQFEMQWTGNVLLNCLNLSSTALPCVQEKTANLHEEAVTQKLRAQLKKECADIGAPGGPVPARKPLQKASSLCLVAIGLAGQVERRSRH